MGAHGSILNKKETAIIVSRIEQWNNRLKDYFIEDRTALTSKYAGSNHWNEIRGVDFFNNDIDKL